MSEIKVNKITPRVACGTRQLGDSGDTFTIPSGATITNAGTASGFGATGETSWDTTVKTTGTFTATAGVGYFLNTTGGIITVNLPVGAAGSSVALADYAGTWQTNAVTVAANGTEKIGGVDADVTLNTEGQSVTFVYIDGTQGWVNVLDSTSNVRGSAYITACGGNSTVTCGNYKTHIFTGPGCFTVSAAAASAPDNVVDYFVVAGGGGGGSGANPAYMSGGGGAGGFRVFSTAPGSNSPLNNSGASPNTEVTVSAATYPIAVGGGGAAASSPNCKGCAGSVSTFSSVTSAGGGFGAAGGGTPEAGGPGGSGGGSSLAAESGGTGNTPPVSPPQGNNGGQGTPGNNNGGGGGGGAGAVGSPAPGNCKGGDGGIGSYIADPFIGPTAPSYGTPGPVSNTRYFTGGGGAPSDYPGGGPIPSGGAGGGGAGGPGGSPPNTPAVAGTVNTGGGGGGGSHSAGGCAAAGGSGVVMIRYRYQ